MSTDYAEKEREFLDALEADSGRSLAAWMEAIAAQKFSDKNEVIDWLRQQGFMFSKASWLERIHENGGLPIYSAASLSPTGPDPEPPSAGPASIRTGTAAETPVADAAPARATAAAVPPSTQPPPALAPDPPLDELLLKAKALQPLARHLLREIRKAVPAATFAAAGPLVSIMAEREFAVLVIGPKELKFGLGLAGEPISAPLTEARFPAHGPRVSASITHMAALTDARQVNAALLGAIVKAAAKS